MPVELSAPVVVVVPGSPVVVPPEVDASSLLVEVDAGSVSVPPVPPAATSSSPPQPASTLGAAMVATDMPRKRRLDNGARWHGVASPVSVHP
jgi:hypothetical protein